MKRAVKLPQYSDAHGFLATFGVVVVQLDKVTNRLATPSCPQTYTVAFIAGTEPKENCDQAFADHRGFFSKIFGYRLAPGGPPPPNTNGEVRPAPMVPQETSAAGSQPERTVELAKEEKRLFQPGLWRARERRGPSKKIMATNGEGKKNPAQNRSNMVQSGAGGPAMGRLFTAPNLYR